MLPTEPGFVDRFMRLEQVVVARDSLPGAHQFADLASQSAHLTGNICARRKYLSPDNSLLRASSHAAFDRAPIIFGVTLPDFSQKVDVSARTSTVVMFE